MTNEELITRREAVLRVAAVLGGTLAGQGALLTGSRTDSDSGPPFTSEEVAFLDEVAETILPETSTPGARAAQTGAFMALMVMNAYDRHERRIFRNGIRELDRRSDEMFGASFMAATPAQRLELLEVVDLERKLYNDRRRQGPLSRWLARFDALTGRTAHYFGMMKELALVGYFTSEIGCTRAQRYVETPGRFDPSIPHLPGEKAWARHG